MFDFAKSEKLKPTDLKSSEPIKTSDYTTYGMTETCNNCVHYEACKAMYQIAYKDFNNYTFIRACELYKSAADVEEVKHGQWIEVDDGVLIGNGKHIECSKCGTWRKDKQKLNYCPNCGAKMDGGKQDDL